MTVVQPHPYVDLTLTGRHHPHRAKAGPWLHPSPPCTSPEVPGRLVPQEEQEQGQQRIPRYYFSRR